jgi:RNA polymerase-binding protein DksA
MSTVDVEAFRDRQLEERKRETDAIDYLHQENPGSMEDETEEMPLDNHLAEMASITLDREIDYSLEESATQVVGEIDAALSRIEQGTYGTCERCGQEIPRERLGARPWAKLCIDCQRKEERG